MSAMPKWIDRDFFIARVRSLQARHSRAHAALLNWGHWSADRRGIFPGMRPPGLWNNFKRSEVQEWGEEQAPSVAIAMQPIKPEPPEKSHYDERTALVLDERIHGYGGLGLEHKRLLRVVYVSREVPEDQFPKLTGCGEDGFCDRLELALLFVEKFR